MSAKPISLQDIRNAEMALFPKSFDWTIKEFEKARDAAQAAGLIKFEIDIDGLEILPTELYIALTSGLEE